MQKDKGRDLGTRIASAILDHFILSMAVSVVMMVLILIILGITYLTIGLEGESFQQYGMIPIFLIVFVVLFMFSLYFNKDGLGGRGPAKRFLKLVVVNKTTGEVAHPLRSFLRNLTLFMWPIEFLFMVITPNRRRLGDFIAGTEVVEYNEELKVKTKFKDLILPIFLGMLFICLLFQLEMLIFGIEMSIFDAEFYKI